MLKLALTPRQELTNEYTGIYNYSSESPYWLISNFDAPEWTLEFPLRGKEPYQKVIDWGNVILPDRERLTSDKHAPLLNAFKYWITAVDDPFTNGGKQLKPKTVLVAIRSVISLINAILLHADEIDLANRHLSAINDDFVMALLVDYAEDGGVENGFYHYHDKAESLLRDAITNISDDEAKNFAEKHPFLLRDLPLELTPLNLSVDDRVKACCWLEQQEFYRSTSNTNRGVTRPQGNSTILKYLVYREKILCCNDLQLSMIEELPLIDSGTKREYAPVQQITEGTTLTEFSIVPFIAAFKYLLVANDHDKCSHIADDNALKNITVSRIQGHVKLKKSGRTQTLPYPVVFKLYSDAFTFCDSHTDAILDSVLAVLKAAKGLSRTKVNTIKKATKRSIFGQWKVSDDWHHLVNNHLLTLGVNNLFIDPMREDWFDALRANNGLFNLFSVLIGSAQLHLGAMCARRQDELTSLMPFGNLSPNLDPSSPIGKKSNYNLIFRVKKTGSGGKNAINDEIQRPIPRSVALLIWKIEQFNQDLIDNGLAKKGNLALFNNINNKSLTVFKSAKKQFNANFDVMCDYLESQTVIDKKGITRRYYIRQHPLRRFFAMIFFWSSGYDGLETIRWMLGHSDVEHLYNYITESQTGGAIKGVKAAYLVEALQSGVKLEGIDSLREVIANRYGVSGSAIRLYPSSVAVETFEDEDDYKTTPPIDDLDTQAELESQVLELLEEDIITLEPNFFKVEGSEQQFYNLVLQVKEIG